MLRVAVFADDLIGRESTAVSRELLKRPGAFVETYRTRVWPDEPYCHEEWEVVHGRTIERDCLPHTLSDEPASMRIFRELPARNDRGLEFQRQNKRREEFASEVSHDLRNILNVAEGQLELARQHLENEHLEHVTRASDRINELIEGLPVRPGWGCRHCRLRRLLEELFPNAVEHGRPSVTVSVDDHPRGFFVEDDGRGISLTNEIYLRPGFSTVSDGTGLGLSIAEWGADEHEWAIDMQRSLDGDARFEFRAVEGI